MEKKKTRLDEEKGKQWSGWTNIMDIHNAFTNLHGILL